MPRKIDRLIDAEPLKVIISHLHGVLVVRNAKQLHRFLSEIPVGGNGR